MKKILWVLILLFSAGLSYAEDRLSLSGYLKNETALRVNDFNNDLQKTKNIVQLAVQYKIKGDDLVFFFKAKYGYDFAYIDRSKYSSAKHYMLHTQRTDWLRDCYLDINSGPWMFRLGKQQVAWGQSDGIAVLDRINPVDISEYWIPDMEDIRIPLWMANMNYSPKMNSNLQVLVIPDFQQSTSAPIGAPYCTYAYQRYNGWKNGQLSVNESLHMPPLQLKNSTFAMQWSDRIGDLDYTLNFLSGFYNSARNTTLWLSGPRGGGPTTSWQVDRSFKSWRLYGASFNKTFTNPGLMQGITLKGDFAYYNKEPTYYGDPTIASASGIKRWNNKFWILGLDKYLITRLLLSVQAGQYILEHSKVLGTTAPRRYPMNPFTYGAQDGVENIFSIKLSTNFLNERLRPEVLWSFTDDNQGRVAPKLNFELRDNIMLTFGLNFFYGDMFDSNGQYQEQNQFFTNIKYTF